MFCPTLGPEAMEPRTETTSKITNSSLKLSMSVILLKWQNTNTPNTEIYFHFVLYVKKTGCLRVPLSLPSLPGCSTAHRTNILIFMLTYFVWCSWIYLWVWVWLALAGPLLFFEIITAQIIYLKPSRRACRGKDGPIWHWGGSPGPPLQVLQKDWIPTGIP